MKGPYRTRQPPPISDIPAATCSCCKEWSEDREFGGSIGICLLMIPGPDCAKYWDNPACVWCELREEQQEAPL